MMEAEPLPVKVMAVEEPSHTIDLSNVSCSQSGEEEGKEIVPIQVHHKKVKRGDIQGLRTVAIFAVLMFHLWPKVFTNGFLGVDIFYVISGYLMAQILSKHDYLNWARVSTFYSRRIHRIVPIYLVIVYVTLHLGSFMLSSEDYREMCRDALTALTFTTNFQNIYKDDDYFAQVFTYRFFLHTWSLAVEMQFYLLVPFIFYVLLKPIMRSKACWISLLVMIASFSLQLSTNEAISFGLVFCRFWQFFAGIMAFFLGEVKKEAVDEEEINLFSLECDSENEKKGLLQMGEVIQTKGDAMVAISSTCATLNAPPTSGEILSNRLLPILRFLPTTLLILLILALIFPWLEGVKMEVLQMTVVLCTACLLYLGSFQSHPAHGKLLPMPYALTNKASVEVGDASYVWYLIHWPAIEFTIYWSAEGVLSVLDGILVLFGTVLGAVAIDKVVDARIRRIPTFKSVLMIIGVLYCFCVVFVIPPDVFGGGGQAADGGGVDALPLDDDNSTTTEVPSALTTTEVGSTTEDVNISSVAGIMTTTIINLLNSTLNGSNATTS